MGGGDKRPAQGGEGLAGDIRHGGGRSQSIRRGRPPIQGKQSQAQFPGKRSTGSAVCLIAVDDFSTFGSRSISFSFFFLLCFISPAFRG
ncbi:unnamed protein product [Linum tenue]|uniref:Uncharacterized protein n=1 Tax=Linum tenue TaxID=586396 RepID=A0AAV0RY13_9ROSI|nr:unnamed protein product [Linum tenue]